MEEVTLTQIIRDAYLNCETRVHVRSVVATTCKVDLLTAKKMCTSFLYGKTEAELQQVKETGLLIGEPKK